MAVGQRPARDVALNEASGPPAWKSIPAWFVFGELDKHVVEANAVSFLIPSPTPSILEALQRFSK